MKLFLIFSSTLTIILSANVAHAVPGLGFERGISPAGYDLYTLFVDARGEEYDSIEVIVENAVFNQSGGSAIFALPSDDTGFIGASTVLQGGTVVAAEDSVTSFSGVAGFQAPNLISDLVGPTDALFQAVVIEGAGFDYTINFLRAGEYVYSFEARGILIPHDFPEPDTMALAWLSMFGLAVVRRRHWF